jgi:hypothetical protein
MLSKVKLTEPNMPVYAIASRSPNQVVTPFAILKYKLFLIPGISIFSKAIT